MSASPPKATELLHYGNGRFGPTAEVVVATKIRPSVPGADPCTAANSDSIRSLIGG